MKKNGTVPTRELVFQRIREDILTSRINEGEKLFEAELAEKYHVSRTPVREALLILQRDGYVTIRKNNGAVVRKLSPARVRDMFETIAILEGRATEKLTEDMISTADLDYLKRLEKKMEMAADEKKIAEYMDLNLSFHQHILDCYGNESVRQISLDLRKKVYRKVYRGLSVPLYINNYLEDHRRIIAALERRDFLKAGFIMDAHLNAVAVNLYNTMTHPKSLHSGKG
jgi:DNA-binding GntR family transcriptional regulator